MFHNNLYHFKNTKNLSSEQVCSSQKLSKYYFQIYYDQGKANKASDILLQYFIRSAEKQIILQVANIKILHYLQWSLAKVSNFVISNFSLIY